MGATIIKNLVSRNRHFMIVKDENGFYMAIEDKYITNGKTNTELNGLQTNASRDLNECIKTTLNKVEMDYLVESGYTKAEAFSKIFNLPLEACKALF